MSARLSRQLQLETELKELQELPGLLQQGGLLLSSHLQTLLARPEMLQGVAEKLSHVVMGGRTGQNFQPTDNNSKPTVCLQGGRGGGGDDGYHGDGNDSGDGEGDGEGDGYDGGDVNGDDCDGYDDGDNDEVMVWK